MRRLPVKKVAKTVARTRRNEDMIKFDCLKCQATWERPAEQDPVGECPSCGSDDYDRPRRGSNFKTCPVCLEEYPGATNAHGVSAPCSRQCRDVARNRSLKKIGVFI